MPRELTGRHVAAITVSFFAVIIAVNLYMASQAIGTFPGVEGRNTFYASQNFDVARRAQQALGWEVTDDYRDGMLELRFTEAATGRPGAVRDLQVLVGRATEQGQDQSPVFAREGGAFVAPLVLAPGKWLVRIEARAEDGTLFRQQRQLYIRG